MKLKVKINNDINWSATPRSFTAAMACSQSLNKNTKYSITGHKIVGGQILIVAILFGHDSNLNQSHIGGYASNAENKVKDSPIMKINSKFDQSSVNPQIFHCGDCFQSNQILY